jgi:hypothetical protein
MRRLLLLAGSGVLLSAILLAGCAQPNKQLYYGTWTSENGTYKKSIHKPDGAIENYFSADDAVPVEKARGEIVKCWLDSEGNTWFQTEGTIIEGPHKNSAPKVQTLEKISKSGSFLEVMVNGVVEFNPKSFPTKIDPTNPLYMSFNRAGK